MKTVAVIGAGLIGRSWSVVFLRAGLDVRLTDIDPGAVERATKWIGAEIADVDKAGKLHGTDDLADAIETADYVQECSSETLSVKTELFAALDKAAGPNVILASSTSALRASDFCRDMQHPERALVAHPVNPPHLVPLVELVPSKWTEQQVVLRTRALMLRVGQSPIDVNKEVPGFVLNRLQAALVNEAMHLVDAGVAGPDDIDQAVRSGLGLRWAFMGPFETMDLNANGGIAGYFENFRETFAEISRSLGANEPWSDAACQHVTEQRRQRLPLGEISQRQAWRDTRVAALRDLKSQL